MQHQNIFGNLRDCVFRKVSIDNKLQQIYEEHSDKSYVGIFSFDKPTLLIREVDLVKNILVKDSQYFIDHTVSVNEEFDPLMCNSLLLIKGQRWRLLRTNLTSVFTSGNIKMMFCLVDTCCKDPANCLDKATADGRSEAELSTTYFFEREMLFLFIQFTECKAYTG